MTDTKSEFYGRFTVRTQNCLAANNIESFEELCKYSSLELRYIPNFGKKSLIEVYDELAVQGLELKDKPNTFVPTKPIKPLATARWVYCPHCGHDLKGN